MAAFMSKIRKTIQKIVPDGVPLIITKNIIHNCIHSVTDTVVDNSVRPLCLLRLNSFCKKGKRVFKNVFSVSMNQFQNIKLLKIEEIMRNQEIL